MTIRLSSVVAPSELSDPGVARQLWLQRMTEELRTLFAERGYKVPGNVRVAVAFTSHGAQGRAIGECWADWASSDNHSEIFIKATLADPRVIVATLAHELVHATVGLQAGHGKVFKRCAEKIGLAGKMTATIAGPALAAWIVEAIARVGDYPAGSLANLTTGRKKQGTRLLKAECETCGYLVRVTRKWVEDAGAPHCPAHGAMSVDGVETPEPVKAAPLKTRSPKPRTAPKSQAKVQRTSKAFPGLRMPYLVTLGCGHVGNRNSACAHPTCKEARRLNAANAAPLGTYDRLHAMRLCVPVDQVAVEPGYNPVRDWEAHARYGFSNVDFHNLSDTGRTEIRRAA